ncbi:outer membrane beta-barrel protein [Helicobacter sp. 11S02596-1]|uniref:outer membrane beta-barrel protein n=1 Tax=Helicobacter sp. 11S02596-1 TaxID=1476194 RepID=UPI000BA707FB|nr:outer membrane beta-barrel protein [Helicobacter sp. 11S02596-1]PAF42097.1 hypothetical protein BJI48_07230 [Helicobacter sp. 11S02596-1]
MQVFKKILMAGCYFALGVSSAFAQDLSATNKKLGLFIGAEAGYQLLYTSVKTDSIDESVADNSILAGLRLGYEQYFNPYIGLRGYGTFDYAYAFDKKKGLTAVGKLIGADANNYFKYGINADLLVNFTENKDPIGLFVGVGYQWVQNEYLNKITKAYNDNPTIDRDKNNVSDNGFVVNAGLSKVIDNHRIELGARIPLYNYIKVDSEGGKTTIRNPIDIYLAYNYVF